MRLSVKGIFILSVIYIVGCHTTASKQEKQLHLK